MKKKLITPIIMVLSAALLYYMLLPAINIHDFLFWVVLIILMVELLLLTSVNELITFISHKVNRIKAVEKHNLKGITIATIAVIVIAVLYIVVVPMIYSPMFMSSRYASRIAVQEVSFDEVPAYDFNQTAIIDRSSASILGNKVMGQMSDLVSQFVVSEEYSQISYKEGTYRVTPMMYDGFIKYLKNKSEGIPGYIIVNTTTGETNLVRLEKKMRYVPSAYFNNKLARKLRFEYPFDIFGSPSFEIDEEGNPYYVCTTYTYVGCDTLKKVTGVILFDPITGESTKYAIDEAPAWIDRIYPESLVREEIDDYGRYRNGFFNSFLAQEGVIEASEGYNYISKDGDIWLYTGMTSVVSDSSNIGFMLVNLRTHEAQLIGISSADEISVMQSTEGEVLNYGYTATFPVLVNVANKPFYILSLKDTAGLVKMYALVDAQDYQQVYTVKADKDAKTAISELIALAIGKAPADSQNSGTKTLTITIQDIKKVEIEGNTYYFLLADEQLYQLKADLSNITKILYLQTGNTLEVSYFDNDEIRVITALK